MISYNNLSSKSHSNTGFTLIELIIVMAIVGVILSLALPSYNQSLHKARRAEAKTLLLDLANRQEQLMLDSSTYTTDLAQLGYSEDKDEVDDRVYSPKLNPCVSGSIETCYLLTAVPVKNSHQEKDKNCTSFSLDSFGKKTATGDAKDECW